jgi:hypothetical protein
MADAIYSDQLSMNAYRVGKTSVMLNDASEEDMKEYLSESKAWQNYDTNSSSLLIISSVGDDGTDVQESLIPVCQ